MSDKVLTVAATLLDNFWPIFIAGLVTFDALHIMGVL